MPLTAVVWAFLSRAERPLDSRETLPGMPDAPTPRYDSHGNLVAAWAVQIGYSPITDLITVGWQRGDSPWASAKAQSDTFPYTDVEDAVAHAQRRVRILGSPRLF